MTDLRHAVHCEVEHHWGQRFLRFLGSWRRCWRNRRKLRSRRGRRPDVRRPVLQALASTLAEGAVAGTDSVGGTLVVELCRWRNSLAAAIAVLAQLAKWVRHRIRPACNDEKCQRDNEPTPPRWSGVRFMERELLLTSRTISYLAALPARRPGAPLAPGMASSSRSPTPPHGRMPRWLRVSAVLSADAYLQVRVAPSVPPSRRGAPAPPRRPGRCWRRGLAGSTPSLM